MPAPGHAFARRDLGDRHSAVQEAEDPQLALGLLSARRASRRKRPIAAKGRGGFDGQGVFSVGVLEYKDRTSIRLWQEICRMRLHTQIKRCP